MILDLELHSDPSNDEESKLGYPPKWYMVSCDWLFKWKCFVSNKVSKNAIPNTNIQNEIRTSLNQRIGILPPGPITNNCLFVNDSQPEQWFTDSKSPKNATSRTSRQQIIKHNLVNERDYKTVKKEVWEKFTKIYGGGPAIIREKPYIYSNPIEDKPPVVIQRQKSIDPVKRTVSPRAKANTQVQKNQNIQLLHKNSSGMEGEKKNIFGKGKERNRAMTGAKKKLVDQEPSSAKPLRGKQTSLKREARAN